MHRFIAAAVLSAGLGFSVGCGSRDTTVGESREPLNGADCDEPGRALGNCTCYVDGSWFCSGQRSVTCSSTYVSHGGRPLVDQVDGCVAEWSQCSDGRLYGAECDGLSCTCHLDLQSSRDSAWPGEHLEGQVVGKFTTPRCPDMAEISRGCGYSLKYPDGFEMGGTPNQGMPCTTLGAADRETGCVCAVTGWDCPNETGCRLGGAWRDEAGNVVHIGADGTWFSSPSAGADRLAIERGAAPGTYGTYMISGTTLVVRSAPSCAPGFATYEVSFPGGCGGLSLHLASDECESRRDLLGGFEGARTNE